MIINLLREAKIIAHRGVCAHAPENTLSSFQKAHESGASWVEFDVMLTRDGEAIIFHDDTVDRTTDGTGHVADLDFDHIRSFDAGSWFDHQFVGEKVPALKELLDYFAPLNMNMNIEIKPTKGKGRATAQKTLDILAKHWPNDNHPPIISSRNHEAIGHVQKVAPTLMVASIVHEQGELAGAIDSPVISINHELIDEAFMAQIKQRHKVVMAYTVNDRARADELMSMGVTAVFSDFGGLLNQDS